VYKAVVRATGQVVALKVQRPEAQASAAIDMFILRRFAAWFKQWKKLRTDMVGVADEFGSQLFQELDYIAEGQNAVRFKELYGSIPGIYVPSINFDLTSR
jgi:predicted unusual protein kinase regulating ubiquinone biosynthesis (AarF/ABC1/UbiB family)